MRGPRLFLFFRLEIGKDHKKRSIRPQMYVFTKNIGEDKKRPLLFVIRPLIFYEALVSFVIRPLIFYEVPHFLVYT